MSIAPTLQRYLDQIVTYEVIQHEPTMSSTRTAEVCHVSGDRVAKAIVLRRDGGYLLAVLPASHHIHLQDLRMQLDDKVWRPRTRSRSSSGTAPAAQSLRSASATGSTSSSTTASTRS
jgi:prolyl-tRNA editing enzyme YbaK/EbsC (Cys-tRNA(Pro) deacylase)